MADKSIGRRARVERVREQRSRIFTRVEEVFDSRLAPILTRSKVGSEAELLRLIADLLEPLCVEPSAQLAAIASAHVIAEFEDEYGADSLISFEDGAAVSREDVEDILARYIPFREGEQVAKPAARSWVVRRVRDDVVGALLRRSELRTYDNATRAQYRMRGAARGRTGNTVKFALVPSGGKTCAHCVMLASRGFDYLSESSARAARHAHCDCVVAPSFAKHPVIKGYDPEGLKRAYMLARQSAFVEYGEAREEQIKAQLREMFPHLVSDHHVKASLAQGDDDGTIPVEKWLDFREAMARKLLTHAEDLNFEDAGAVRGFVVSHRLPPVAPPSKRLLKDWPKDLPALSTERLAHILYGYNRGSGHLNGYGWNKDGTRFEPSFTPSGVVDLLMRVLREGSTSVGDRGKVIFSFVSRGNIYRAILNPRGTLIQSFYPVSDAP